MGLLNALIYLRDIKFDTVFCASIGFGLGITAGGKDLY